jgi:hypothetical protein
VALKRAVPVAAGVLEAVVVALLARERDGRVMRERKREIRAMEVRKCMVETCRGR